MQAYEEELFLGHLVYVIFLEVGAHLYVLLDDVVAELVIDEVVDVGVKILEYLIFEELVGGLESDLYVPGAVLVPAPLGHKLHVIEYFLFSRIYRKVVYGGHINILEALVPRVLLLVLQTQPNSQLSYFLVLLTCS